MVPARNTVYWTRAAVAGVMAARTSMPQRTETTSTTTTTTSTAPRSRSATRANAARALPPTAKHQPKLRHNHSKHKGTTWMVVVATRRSTRTPTSDAARGVASNSIQAPPSTTTRTTRTTRPRAKRQVATMGCNSRARRMMTHQCHTITPSRVRRGSLGRATALDRQRHRLIHRFRSWSRRRGK